MTDIEKKMTRTLMYCDVFSNSATMQIGEQGSTFAITKRDEPELFNIIISDIRNYCAPSNVRTINFTGKEQEANIRNDFIQDKCRLISDGGSELLCLYYISAMDPRKAVADATELKEKGLLDEYGRVFSAESLLQFLGITYHYVRKTVQPEAGIYIAKYMEGEKVHAVVKDADKGEVRYNPTRDTYFMQSNAELPDYGFLLNS